VFIRVAVRWVVFLAVSFFQARFVCCFFLPEFPVQDSGYGQKQENHNRHDHPLFTWTRTGNETQGTWTRSGTCGCTRTRPRMVERLDCLLKLGKHRHLFCCCVFAFCWSRVSWFVLFFFFRFLFFFSKRNETKILRLRREQKTRYAKTKPKKKNARPPGIRGKRSGAFFAAVACRERPKS